MTQKHIPGGKLDPEYLNKDKVNKMLRIKDYGLH